MEGISHSIITKYYARHEGDKKRKRVVKHKVGIRYSTIYKCLLNLYMCLKRSGENKDIICQITRVGMNLLLCMMIEDAKPAFVSEHAIKRNTWSIHWKKELGGDDTSLGVLSAPFSLVACPDARPTDTVYELPSYVEGVIVLRADNRRVFVPNTFFEKEVITAYVEQENRQNIRRKNRSLLLIVGSILFNILIVYVLITYGEFFLYLLSIVFAPLYYLYKAQQSLSMAL